MTDTAGLRDTNDPIEQAGIDRAMAEAAASALILAVFDGSRPLGTDMLVLARSAGHRAIAVVNKDDLPRRLEEKLLKSISCISYPFPLRRGGPAAAARPDPQTVGFGDGAFDGALITNSAGPPRWPALPSGARPRGRRSVRNDARRCCDGRGGRDRRAGRDHRRNRDRAVVSRIFSDFCVGK